MSRVNDYFSRCCRANLWWSSNNDGCVIARSDEAKALGIPMGLPAFKLTDLLQEHPLEVFSSNYTLYSDLSARVMTTLTSGRQPWKSTRLMKPSSI